MNNINIGDLVMCRAKINPKLEEKNNLKEVVGWVTKAPISMIPEHYEYAVQWSDKEFDMPISGEDVRIVREFYLRKRREIGL